MKEYSDLTPEDLIEDPAFRAWIYHGTGDAAWKTWLNGNSERHQAVEAARNVLLSVRGEFDRLPASEIKGELRKLLDTLQSQGEPTLGEDVGQTGSHEPAWWRAIAAALVVLGALGVVFYLQQKSDGGTGSEVFATQLREDFFTEIYNDTETQKLVNLPDGSSVLLMSASKIAFPKEFNLEKREVTLSGEAFFEVQKNVSHPFFVYAGEMITRVLGTSFTVKAYEDDEMVSVRVKSGKVSVSARNPVQEESAISEEEEIILQPNQQAVLSRSDRKIALLTEQKPGEVVLPIEIQSFEFRRTSVSEVLEAIKTTYNVDIRYDGGVLQDCSITASLGDEPLMEKLNMICEAIGASYHVDDNQVVHVSSEGCD